MSTLLLDIRHSLRQLIKNPGFTFVCLLTLALGIGANIVVFGVVNAALLRPLPYADADRLVEVREENQMNRGREMPAFMTSPTREAWNTNPQTIESIAGYNALGLTLFSERIDDPLRVRGAHVTHDLFPMLGVTPLLGRGFTEMDGRPKTDKTWPAAILSYGAWQDWYDGQPDAIGEIIKISSGSVGVFTIVGVMPEGFAFPEQETRVWFPLSMYPRDDRSSPLGDATSVAFSGIAKLREGVSIVQAQAEGQTVLGRLTSPITDGATLRLESLHDQMVGEARPALLALMAAVALVLLIVTANLANLLLARGAARQRELAVRAAIGAGRGRLVRQLVTESVVLGLVGGVLGLAVSFWVLGALPTFAPTGVPGLDGAVIDRTVLMFTVAVSLGAGLFFGMAPALKASRFNLVGALNENAPAMGGGFRFRPGNRTRSVLVVAEVALALMLLVGAGLLVRSIVGLTHVDPGFNPEGVLSAEINLLPMKEGELLDEGGLFDHLRRRIGGHPGVEAVGFVSSLPLTPGESMASIRFEGQPPPTRISEVSSARPQLVSPGYFEAMGLRLVTGRFLTDLDLGNGLATVVNEAFVSAYLPGGRVLGEGILLVGERPYPIVGVVGDVLHRGLDSRPEPELYITYAQWPFGSRLPDVDVVVRTNSDPRSFVPFLVQDVAEVQPFAIVDDIMSMEARLAATVAQPRFFTIVLGAFAVAALVLAMVGIYGVLSYTVSRRGREIGLRMALGADASGIRHLVVRQGALLIGVGVAFGLAGAIATSRFFESMLFGVTALDVPTLIFVPLLLVVVALVACYLPARRATRIDPMVALRAE
jgi:putative ABC transport system permease protein